MDNSNFVCNPAKSTTKMSFLSFLWVGSILCDSSGGLKSLPLWFDRMGQVRKLRLEEGHS